MVSDYSVWFAKEAGHRGQLRFKHGTFGLSGEQHDQVAILADVSDGGQRLASPVTQQDVIVSPEDVASVADGALQGNFAHEASTTQEAGRREDKP